MSGGLLCRGTGLVGLVIDTHHGDFVKLEVFRIDGPVTTAPRRKPVR
jgi:hypothetical protein